jgi:GrpB-like predicted nucleotidyltransferase (UPF0157 family)
LSTHIPSVESAPVEIVDYDPAWPERFLAERAAEE